MTRRRFRFPLWIVLGVALVVALLAGSGVFSSSPPTAAQRANAIESDLRCPSCEDLSVADSTAQTAVTVRAEVRQLIAEGKTDGQIKSYLEARYGSTIILVPPASGWSLLIWLLPTVGGAAAIAVLVVVLVRKRRTAYDDPVRAAAAESVVEARSGLVQLEERRHFLQQSLSDATAEHGAGDLSDDDYRALVGRDSARLAALDERIGALTAPAVPGGADTAAAAAGTASGAVVTTGVAAVAAAATDGSAATASVRTPRPKRSRRQRVFLGSGIAALGLAAVVVVALMATNRLPGQTPTGGATLDQQQKIEQTLIEAADDENDNQVGEAAQLYQQVLSAHPDNEVAMAQLGWLEYETGAQGKSTSLIADARAKLNRAVQLSPGDYAAHLYLGTLLYEQDGNASGAVAQYQQFLTDDPPSSVLSQAASIVRQAYQKAGVAVPKSVPAK